MDITVVKIEVEGGKIEVEYSDGSEEEIDGGIYERKNAAGDTVEERPATAADRDRLAAYSVGDPRDDPGGVSETPGGGAEGIPLPDPSTITKVEIVGSTIEIEYADGSKEEIEAGRYERKNPAGDTVEERPATAEDGARLDALAAGVDPMLVAREITLADGTRIETGLDKLEVTFPDGSRTEIEFGRYEEKTPAGDTIVERPATQGDIDALTALLPPGVTAPDLSVGAAGPGDDDGTPDPGPGDGPGTPGDDNPTPGDDDGTPDQGPGDGPGTPGDDNPTPGDDDGTPDQGPGDAPGTPGADDTPTPGDDDGTPDQGPGDAPGTPGADDGLVVAQNVTLFYTETLGRAPETGGLNFWIDQVEGGLSLERLADAFIDSFEFASVVGDPDGMDDRTFVETLYDDLLDRGSDDAGAAFWTGFLGSGGTRADLVLAFVISEENRATTPELDALVETSPGEWEIAG